MENIFKRLLSLAIALVMIVSMIPGNALSVFAAEEDSVIDTEAELATALAAGGTVTLGGDITVDTKITAIDGTVIDLNGKTLYINVENSYYNNVTIKNGNIVLGKDDVHVCDGYFLVNAGKTLVLDGVNVTSADGGIKGYAVFHLKTGANLDLLDSTVEIGANEYEAGYVVYAGEGTATVDITGTTLTVDGNGIVHAATTIDDSTITINAQEHGINRSGVTINDSTVTISGGTGRGITAENGDLTITGNSVVSVTDMGEATIELRGNKNLTVAETADVTVDAAVNNTTSGTIVGTVKLPASGTITSCLVNLSDPEETFISSEIQNLNATESVVIKLYSGETQIATTTLQKPEYYVMATLGVKIIITGESSSWKTEWAEGMPRADVVPDKVTLYVDGKEMTSANVPMISTDGEKAVNWADVPGVNPAPVTGLKGEGTAEDPYLIGNLEELKWFRDTVNTYTSDGSNQFKGKYVKLTADIDLDGENWEPIGTNSVGDHMAFLGTFDGDGHTISNLYINADGDHLGFFARVGSYAEGLTPTVKNITFNNVDVSSNTTTGHGGSYVGGVIANAGGNSVVSGITVTGDVYVVGYAYVGGIVGHGYPDIDNCHVKADYGWVNAHYWCAGGIIGYAGEGGTPITNCSVSGLDIWSDLGGAAAVAGLLQDGNKLENVSASNVKITSNNDYCMGYIAGNGEASTMTDITATDVTATAEGQPITSTDAVATVDGTIYFDLHSAMAAAQAGQTITLLKDVTVTEKFNLTGVNLDLNDNTLYLQTTGSYIVDTVTISNGTIDISGGTAATGNSYFTVGGQWAKAGSVLNLTDVELVGKDYVSKWAVICVHNNTSLNMTGCTVTLENDNGTAGGFIKDTSGVNNTATITIEDSKLTLTNVDRGFTGGKLILDTVELTITGGENGINGSELSAKDSTITISNGTGRALTLNKFDANIVNSTLSFSNMGEGAIRFKTANELTIDAASTMAEVTAYADAEGATINGQALTGTEDDMSTATVAGGVTTIVNPVYVAQIGTTTYKTLAEALAAANAGDTITLLADVTLTDSICIDKSLTIDGNGKTITSSNNRVIKINTVSNGAEAVVLKNVTVTSTASGGRCVQLAGSALKELTLDTVTLTATNGATQPITLSEQNSEELLKVTIKSSTVTASNNNAYALIAFCPIDATIVDSTLSGFAALYFKGNYDNTGVYSSEGSKVAVTDSTLTGTNVQNGNNSFSVISFEAGNIDLTVTGGSINAAATGEAANSILGAKDGITGITATLDTELNVGEDCGYFGMGTGINNQQISVRAEYADELNALGYAFKTSATEGMIAITGFAVAKIGNTPYATLAEAFTAAQDGDEVVILAAGTYALSTSGKDITITGAVDGVEFTNIGTKNMNGASVTFNNVTFTYGNENYKGLQHAGNLVYNNCTINGQVFLYGESETFNNCTFNQTSSDAYNVWTYGAKKVAFDECTFNSAGKSVLVYNEGACATDMAVTGCTFVASTAVEGKAAIEIDTSLMPDGTDIAITNSTATGFAAGSVSGNTLWNDKKDQTDLTVTVDDTQVWPIPELPTATVTEIDNKELNFALNFKADEPTDAQLAYYGDWYADFELTFNKDVTMNANGGADGYLSGQYDAWSENWVNVPFENVTLKANEPLKIMEYASQMMGQSGLKLTYNDVASFVKDFNCGVYLTPEYIAANPDLEITLELKMYNPADETESYVIGQTYNFTVPELPTATVTEIENEDLTFALNFKADEPTDEQLAYYGDWYADFELTFNKDVTMNANGGADGYLSGQYDAWSENWVNVPFEDVTLSAGQSLKIMEYASQMMGQSGLKLTYNDVASFVKDFNCGVYLTPEYIAANPDLEITLELKMYNPADETESYVIGQTYNFTADSLGYVAYNVETGKLYTMADEALLEAAEGQTVILLKDTDGYRHVTVFEGITFDVNGFVLGTDYFTSFGDTVDNSEANTGAVNSKRMLIEPDNAQVTVKTDKGYQFIEIIGFNQRITNNNARFEFQPIFEEAAHDMLDEGVAVSGVTIQVDVSWKDGEHTRTQQFKFSDEFVNGFIAAYRGTDANGNHLGYSQAFFLELTNAADYSEVTYSCYVISDTGVSEYAPDINN